MAEDGKLKIDSMMVMISVSVRCRSKTLYIRRSFKSLWQNLNLQCRGHRYRGREYDRGQEVEQKQVKIMEDRRDKCSKLVASRDKEVNIVTGESDDALVCCVKNTVEDRIMDSGASFHATYCKEELDRFRLRSGLKRRLISVGQLDEEGYHVGFKDQQCSVAPETWSFLHNVSKDKETAEFGVAERLSRTFRAESTGLRAEAPKMLWADFGLLNLSHILGSDRVAYSRGGMAREGY
ncbi:hypothetical protein Tco_0903419 [Tanacetum coccineum]